MENKMPLEIFMYEQGSDQWDLDRSQVITASNMGKVLSKGQGATRAAYARQMAAARYRGEVYKTWKGNAETERGHEWEAEAVETYKTITGNDGQAVGFMLNHQEIGGIGYSPDYKLNPGLLEIKTRIPELQIELLESEKVPGTHKAQIQTGLWVAEEDWLDFMCYCRGMPPFLKRVYRDEEYIKELKIQSILFYKHVDSITETLINYDTKSKWI
jgi:hypothetical protein